MGRILVLVGIALVAFGVYGLVSGFSAPTLPNINQTLDASQFCKTGETLVQENGATSYTPGQGYSSTVQYYCEDAKGNRRDITDEFNENLVGSVTGILSAFSTPFNFDMKNIALIGGGLLLAIIGLIVSARRSFANAVPVGVQVDSAGRPVITTSGRVVRVNGQDVIATPEVARYIQQAQAMNTFASMGTPAQTPPSVSISTAGGDLAAKLQQLDEARKAGLITQEEFDQMRQKILDQMK
jgi:hypothetical protein